MAFNGHQWPDRKIVLPWPYKIRSHNCSTRWISFMKKKNPPIVPTAANGVCKKNSVLNISYTHFVSFSFFLSWREVKAVRYFYDFFLIGRKPKKLGAVFPYKNEQSVGLADQNASSQHKEAGSLFTRQALWKGFVWFCIIFLPFFIINILYFFFTLL